MPRVHQDVDLEPDDAETVEGVDQAEEEVRKFLAKLRENDELEGGTRLTLFQNGRTKEDEDAIWEEQFEHAESDEEQANAVVEAASDEIRNLRLKKMKFILRADGARGRCSFTLKFEEGADEADYEDFEETPTRKGLLAQQMRHMEQMTGRLGKKDKLLWEMMERENKRLQERVEKLEERGLASMRAYEDLLSAKHIRDMEVEKMQKQEHRKDQVAGVLMAGIPTVIAKFMGPGAGSAAIANAPGSRTPLEGMVEGLLKTMSKEQFEELQATGVLKFSQEQLMLLFQMIQSVMAREQAESAPAHAGPSGNGANGSPPPAQPSGGEQNSAPPPQG